MSISNGKTSKAISISLLGEGNDLLGFPMNMVIGDRHLYMGAMSQGFNTGLQSHSQTNKDSFVYKFTLPDNYLAIQPEAEGSLAGGSVCPNRELIGASRVNKVSKRYGRSDSEDFVSRLTSDVNDLPRIGKGVNVFEVYYAKFVHANKAKSGIQSPRPCAYKSIQLRDEPVEYYKGASPLKFNVA